MYKELRRGGSGFDVHALQQLINETKILETPLKIDGDFGPATEQAVKTVQYSIGLNASGKVGSITWKELYAATKINTLGLKSYVYAGLTEDQYHTEYQKKDIIFLHHTAGGPNPYYVRDYFQKKDRKVATCYVIGGKGDSRKGDLYDGVILQLYKHPSQWASHINMWDNFNVFGRSRYNAQQRNREHETKYAKRTVAVEVCNYGYLEYVNGGFWFMSKGKPIKQIADEDVVDYGEHGFRGKRYYQKYTDRQIETLRDFIVKSAEFYRIDIDKPKGGFDERWFDYSWAATRQEQSIVSHSSVRSKSDMHPQPELIDMLNSL